MSDYILRTSNLTKKYGDHVAVNDMNMVIKSGDIYGFIGENGAGKTTTVRLLTGIAKPTSGEIEVFGVTGKAKLQKVRSRIGCIIEAPALYDEMTAEENLEIQRIQRGIPGKVCIKEVLKIVQLEDTGKRKVCNLSLGMRQRLALAIALLGNPDFLILDEPTNGLDPMGIVEMRNLLKRINKDYGITMLISSHLLSELYLVATKFGIIHKGVLVEQLSAEELGNRCNKYVKLQVGDVKHAVTVLENDLNIKKYEVRADNTIILYNYIEKTEIISNAVLNAGIDLKSLLVQEDTLEMYFAKVIGGVNCA